MAIIADESDTSTTIGALLLSMYIRPFCKGVTWVGRRSEPALRRDFALPQQWHDGWVDCDTVLLFTNDVSNDVFKKRTVGFYPFISKKTAGRCKLLFTFTDAFKEAEKLEALDHLRMKPFTWSLSTVTPSRWLPQNKTILFPAFGMTQEEVEVVNAVAMVIKGKIDDTKILLIDGKKEPVPYSTSMRLHEFTEFIDAASFVVSLNNEASDVLHGLTSEMGRPYIAMTTESRRQDEMSSVRQWSIPEMPLLLENVEAIAENITTQIKAITTVAGSMDKSGYLMSERRQMFVDGVKAILKD